MELYPYLFALEKNNECNMAEMLDSRGDTLVWNLEWKRRIRNQAQVPRLNHMCEIINGYSFGNGRDRWVWLGDESQNFSIKALRIILENNCSPPDLNPMSWCHWIPLKVRSIAWRARLNRIPSKVGLAAM